MYVIDDTLVQFSYNVSIMFSIYFDNVREIGEI